MYSWARESAGLIQLYLRLEVVKGQHVQPVAVEFVQGIFVLFIILILGRKWVRVLTCETHRC